MMGKESGKYRAVFLDWDDTISDWASSSERAHRVLYDRYGWDKLASFEDWLRLYRAHNAELWDAYAQKKITREYLHIDHFLYPLCFFTNQDKEKATDAMREHCRMLGDEYIALTTQYACLKPFARELVEYLVNKYPLTIVSNGYVETQYVKIEKSGLKPYFSHMIFSEEVGVSKPDPQIMYYAIERNTTLLPNLQPSEVIMIGDNYSSDIQGAQAAGIDTIWYVQPESITTKEQRENVTHIVSNLEEVMDIL